MTRLVRASAWCVAALLLAGPAGAQGPSFEDVVRNLRNPDPKARASAVRMLHEARHLEAVVPVAALIVDPVDAIQLEAIAAELAFFLVEDAPAARRRVALIVEVRSSGQASRAFELGPLATWPRRAPPELVDALLKAVDDENGRVRIEAIYALGVVARPPLTGAEADRLIKVLDHYDPAIRAAGARVIGRLQVARAGDALIAAINDSNLPVRLAAMQALGEIRELRAVQALTEQFAYYKTGDGARAALEGLARIGHASSAPLFKARLADRDAGLRRAAAEGLGRTGDAEAESAVQAAIGSETSGTVRAAMAFAMVRLGQPYVERLVEGFASDRTARQVQEYLLELGPAVLPQLGSGLKNLDAGVRAGVAEVVGALGTTDSIALLEPLTRDRVRAVAETAAAAIDRIKMRQ
jgi:HEAT repeat protein